MSLSDLQAALLQKAYSLLGRRDYTEARLREKLTTYADRYWSDDSGSLGKLVDEIVKGFIEDNTINDTQFARRWVERKIESKPRGPFLLAKELRQQGVPREISRQVISELLPNGQEAEVLTALRVAQKKERSYHHLTDLEKRQKLTGYLSTRGFTFEACKQAIDELLLSE